MLRRRATHRGTRGRVDVLQRRHIELHVRVSTCAMSTPVVTLVGSPQTVAERIKEYMSLGIDSIIGSGYPHMEESYRVAEMLFPLLPIRTPSSVAETNSRSRSQPPEQLASGSPIRRRRLLQKHRKRRLSLIHSMMTSTTNPARSRGRGNASLLMVGIGTFSGLQL